MDDLPRENLCVVSCYLDGKRVESVRYFNLNLKTEKWEKTKNPTNVGLDVVKEFELF